MGRSTWTLMLAVVVAVAVGCRDDRSAAVGTLDVALVATGASGATYGLPAGTELVVSSGPYNDVLSLDGNTASVTYDLPPGTYSGELLWNGSAPGTWYLDRTDTMGTTQVKATLVTAMPLSFDILVATVTPITLVFRVASGEQIVFQHGQLTVDMQVDETTASSYDTHFFADAVTPGEPTFDPAAPPAMRTDFTFDPTTTALSVDVFARVIGPWTKRSSTIVCAPLASHSTFGGGEDAFQDLVTESVGPSPQFCVRDDGAAAGTNTVRITHQRGGAPATARFTGYGLTALYAYTSVRIQIPVRAFDGTNLDTTALSGEHLNRPMTILQLLDDDSSGESVRWYVVQHTATAASFRFEPVP